MAVAMPGPGRAYLGPAGRAALPGYQYRGTDQSLFYRYLSSPGCDWLTAQLPVWVAPNLITLFGFVARSDAPVGPPRPAPNPPRTRPRPIHYPRPRPRRQKRFA